MAENVHGLSLFTAGPMWRAWRVGDELLTSNQHVHGKLTGCRAGRFAGGLAGLNISEPGEPPALAPMCLFRDRNMISDSIDKYGRWHDCAALVRAWRKRSTPPKALMVEVGGNIGACSMEMLLRTDARLIIFEPSATNLYYLTRTLHAAHQHNPQLEIAARVAVFPIGLGNSTSSKELFADTKNSGDSMIIGSGEAGASSTTSRRHKFASQGRVTIHALDELMPWSGAALKPSIIPLMKVDVQGFECRALAGMQRLLGYRAVDAIFTEVSRPHLARARCSQEGLLGILRDFGYQVDQPNGPRGFWSWDILAVGSWA